MKNKILNINKLIKNKNRIDWKQNVGNTLRILYNDKKYSLYIYSVEYSEKRHCTLVTLKYNNIILSPMTTNNILKCKFKNIIN